jgi:excinuclease UvrABC nuclease subunit
MNIIDPFKLPSLPLAWNSALPKCPAIYFAISENHQIFYIGSSTNLHSRWLNHNRFQELKNLGDVRVAWFQVLDISVLRLLESQAIRAYKPFLNSLKRNRGDGSGCIYFRTVTKKGKDYDEAYYHYEIWEKGDRLIKSTKYIPKKLLPEVQQLNDEKAPVREILKLLGGIG